MDLAHMSGHDKTENKPAVGGAPSAPAHLLEGAKSKGPSPGTIGDVAEDAVTGKGSTTDSNKGLEESLDVGGDFPDRNGQHHPIAEFLYQLTKMLTDDNSEIIEWADGRIKVHHPERLEAEVLHKYFRHSKFASFQRQLNYFGFRKMAGKGKMSPCSYVNEAATSDIRSLLLIKRKTNGSAARKAAMEQRAAAMTNPMNNGILGMNISALGGMGNPLGNLSGQNIQSAMALLSENALRAGIQQGSGTNIIGNAQLQLLALQQQQQQLQQQLQQQQHSQQLKQLVQQSQNSSSHEKLMLPNGGQQNNQQAQPQQTSSQGYGAGQSNAQIEQLHAHLANLAASQNQQQQNPATAALSALANSAAAAGAGGESNPATAALQAQNASNPATAALQAASATSQHSNNLFESAINLKSLLQEHQEATNAANAFQGPAGQALLRRLPSANNIFPEQMGSTLSLGNLLQSSNRLNSLLSLNSFSGSREPSLADFAVLNSMAAQQQLAAAGGGQAGGAPAPGPSAAAVIAAANAQLQAEAARLRNS